MARNFSRSSSGQCVCRASLQNALVEREPGELAVEIEGGVAEIGHGQLNVLTRTAIAMGPSPKPWPEDTRYRFRASGDVNVR